MNNTKVYVCPGPSDESETCTFWMSAPGYCLIHPHIDLIEKPLLHTTVPAHLGVPDLPSND